MRINSFKDLAVWQKSMSLVSEIYIITAHLPKKESYGLVTQIQKASISIPSNIAEGSKRSSRVDFRHFCLISLGSAAELETQLLLTQQLYPSIPVGKALDEITEIQKMLTSLVKKLANVTTTN